MLFTIIDVPERFRRHRARRACWPLQWAAVVAFGMFIIVAAAVVAWFADRLAHRRRNLVLADFFEHVLQLPLAYHAEAHSGRQLKIMLTGTDTLWWLWVSFFREHFAAFMLIAVLLPMPLLALCVAFTVLGGGQFLVMRGSTARSSGTIPIWREPAADTLGNVAVVRSSPDRARSVGAERAGQFALARARCRVSFMVGGRCGAHAHRPPR